MKKVIKSSQEEQKEIVFTPAALLDLLSQVDELSEYTIGLTESIDGTLQLQIGQSFYALENNDTVIDIQLSENDIEKIEEINEEAYNEIVDISEEPIEGGLIKEALKTLLIGGVVRLGKNYLKN